MDYDDGSQRMDSGFILSRDSGFQELDSADSTGKNSLDSKSWILYMEGVTYVVMYCFAIFFSYPGHSNEVLCFATFSSFLCLSIFLVMIFFQGKWQQLLLETRTGCTPCGTRRRNKIALPLH